jgi:hypothetical protein
MNGLVLCLDAANAKGYDSTENLLLYSEDFSNAYWTKSNVSIASTTTVSHNNTSNVSKLIESASTAVHELVRGPDGTLAVGTDTYITISIFAKAAERQYCYIRSAGNSKRIAVVVDLSNGTFNVTNWGFTLNSSATVTPYPNGWYRITCTSQSNYPTAPGWSGIFTVSPLDTYQLAGNVGGSGYSYAGDGTSGIFIWGAHYELGPGISNYYPTAGTAKNRGTTWTDLSGRGNTGTLTNGPTYSSANGGSIVFDGTNDYVATASALSGSFASFTVIIWFYPTSVTNFKNPIDCNYAYNGTTGNIGPRLEMTSTGTLAWIYSNDTANNGNFYVHNVVSSGLAANSWHCAAITYDGTSNTSTTYYNGNTTGISRTLSGTPTGFIGVMNNINIGRGFSLGGAERIFAGRVANTQIYNRSLTATEITQNFNALRGRFGI